MMTLLIMSFLSSYRCGVNKKSQVVSVTVVLSLPLSLPTQDSSCTKLASRHLLVRSVYGGINLMVLCRSIIR